MRPEVNIFVLIVGLIIIKLRFASKVCTDIKSMKPWYLSVSSIGENIPALSFCFLWPSLPVEVFVLVQGTLEHEVVIKNRLR
jgi:hypothetical protein